MEKKQRRKNVTKVNRKENIKNTNTDPKINQPKRNQKPKKNAHTKKKTKIPWKKNPKKIEPNPKRVEEALGLGMFSYFLFFLIFNRYVLADPEQYLFMKAPINYLVWAKDVENDWYPALLIKADGNRVRVRKAQ